MDFLNVMPDWAYQLAAWILTTPIALALYLAVCWVMRDWDDRS